MVKSEAEQRHGSWLGYLAQMRLPTVRRDFDLNRDPHVAEQLDDMKKTESQRRASLSSGSLSGQAEGDESGDTGGNSSTQTKGLLAQRDAAFASYQAYKANTRLLDQNHQYHHTPIHRPRYPGPSM